MWTKRQLIEEAFTELALQGYEFDISPEEQNTALRRLDTMMATWEGKGIRVGYLFPSGPDDSDPDSASGLPDSAVETVYLNLAIRLAAGFGKQLNPTTQQTARDGYDALLWRAAMPREQQMPNTLPRGAGNRVYNDQRPFFPRPDDNPLQINRGGGLDILE